MYGWTPKIGDPTPLGWATVGVYAVAAFACALASRHSQASQERRIWLALALLAAFLCLNKQLDLQSLGTAIGRTIAKEQGWYAQRRLYQLEFIIVLSGTALIVAIAMARAARRLDGALRLALIGAGLLMTFILIRATSFHHIDWFLRLGLNGVRTNHMLEIGALALLIVAAGARLCRPAVPVSERRRGSAARPRA